MTNKKVYLKLLTSYLKRKKHWVTEALSENVATTVNKALRGKTDTDKMKKLNDKGHETLAISKHQELNLSCGTNSKTAPKVWMPAGKKR